jgi:hypothetical protein
MDFLMGQGVHTSSEGVHVGRHLVLPEPPDVFFVRLHGPVTTAETAELLDVFDSFCEEKTRVYWLCDITDLGFVSAEARREGSRRVLPTGYAGLVCFGGRFHQRMIAQLAVNGVWLLKGRKIAHARPTFVATEAEARAHVEARRREG